MDTALLCLCSSIDILLGTHSPIHLAIPCQPVTDCRSPSLSLKVSKEAAERTVQTASTIARALPIPSVSISWTMQCAPSRTRADRTAQSVKPKPTAKPLVLEEAAFVRGRPPSIRVMAPLAIPTARNAVPSLLPTSQSANRPELLRMAVSSMDLNRVLQTQRVPQRYPPWTPPPSPSVLNQQSIPHLNRPRDRLISPQNPLPNHLQRPL